MPAKNLLLMDTDIKCPGRKRLQILWTSFMDGPNTLKGWNELLDYLQTNNAFRKSKFINYNFYDYFITTVINDTTGCFGLFE